ncbi:IS630 transposase-related protein [Wielerella bovis]|uniref:IS630 transposase-related protein n=1 Tax=Wielerella bovis TaxID=2917790 RepID=UPI0024B6702A|nr:IS630 transposase-related protein [Wielerella bovis]
MAHSTELRNKALNYYEQCKNISKVAQAYQVSRNTLYQHSDAYLHEIAEHFHCSKSAIFYALKRMDITRKKRPPHTKNKTQIK